MIGRLLWGILALVFWYAQAEAQTTDSAAVVANCGTPPQTYTAGERDPITQDTTGRLCGSNSVAGTVTANQGTPAAIGNAWPVYITVSGVAVPSGHGAAANALRVELPTDGTGVVGLNAGTNIIGKAGIDQTTDVTTNGVEIAPTAGSAAGIAPVNSAALEANHVLKATAGNLYGFQVSFVTCASPPCWVMVYNATSAPVDGAVTPVKWYAVGPNQTIAASWTPGPALRLGTGITIGCSTTGPFTKTATAQCAISGEVM